MSSYGIFTDDKRGSGEQGEYLYEWWLLDDGYIIQALSKNRCFLVGRLVTSTTSAIFWGPDRLGENVVEDVFKLLNNIASEIQQELEKEEARKIQRDIELRGVDW